MSQVFPLGLAPEGTALTLILNRMRMESRVEKGETHSSNPSPEVVVEQDIDTERPR